jgi:hypothetical protein
MQRYVFNFFNSLVVISASGFLAQSIKYVLASGKMSSRNPITRCSSRAPKLNEAETGKFSSSRTARQLDYAPKAEPVIKTSTKKYFF